MKIPDVVLIGEMRDLETIESALRIAETGHLTFGTLHTNSASSTINRIIDVFPAHQQPQIRAQLSLVLEGIMCQSLLPKADGKGRAMCMEILVPNAAVRNLIREDKIHQIYSSMQSGQDKFGMQTFNQALATLYFQKQITLEVAMARSSNQDELQEMINRGAGLLNRNQSADCGQEARRRANAKRLSQRCGCQFEQADLCRAKPERATNWRTGRNIRKRGEVTMPVFTFSGKNAERGENQRRADGAQ